MTRKKVRSTLDDLIIYEPGKIDVHVPEFTTIAAGEQALKSLIQERDILESGDPIEAGDLLQPYWREALEKSIVICKIRLGGLRRLERALVEEIEHADRAIAFFEIGKKQLENKRNAALCCLEEIR